MTKRISRGTCSLCQGEFSKSTIGRHLETCQRKANEVAVAAGKRPGRKIKQFHLVVEGRDLPMYWMHLNVSTGVTLADLDQFLRGTWLECCGHMSSFEVGERRYVSGAGGFFDLELEPGERSMSVRLDKVLSPGVTVLYEYDFGTTTELCLRVLAEESRAVKGESIQILARNTPPQIPCGVCGKPAESI